MMRYVYRLVICFLCGAPLAAAAQTPKVALSEAFPEPSADGWDKLVLLPNGNTCYLHLDKNDGISVALYNEKKELVVSDKINGKQWDIRDMNDTEIDGVYEINGQVVIFLQQLIKYRPSLFRIVIDGKTGHWVQEDKIGELPTVLHREAVALQNLASHDFYVVKDPNSGYYAVAFFAGGELSRKENAAERIQVMHFSPTHELVNQAFYTLPDNAYTYFNFLDMAVEGKNSVYLCTVGFNTKRTEGAPQSQVLVSALKAGQQAFVHQPLDYTANFGGAYASLQWVPAVNRLQLFLAAAPEPRSKPEERRLFMNYLDPATCSLQLQRPLSTGLTAANAQPQLLSVAADGSALLQFEQMQQFSQAQGKNIYNMMHTNLNDIRVCSINAQGEADSGYVISKMQVANGAFGPLYLQRKNRGTWVFRNRIAALNTTPYLSFDLVHTSHGDYTFFNDYIQHLDRGGTFEDKKPLRYLAEANTICYRYDKGVGERLFLFGTPMTDKAYYCMLGASDRSMAGDQYATILITRTAAGKKAQIAWITF
jgi:hypothetical protein